MTVAVAEAISEVAVIVTTIGTAVSVMYVNKPVLGTKVQFTSFPVPVALSVRAVPEVQVALIVAVS